MHVVGNWVHLLLVGGCLFYYLSWVCCLGKMQNWWNPSQCECLGDCSLITHSYTKHHDTHYCNPCKGLMYLSGQQRCRSQRECVVEEGVIFLCRNVHTRSTMRTTPTRHNDISQRQENGPGLVNVAFPVVLILRVHLFGMCTLLERQDRIVGALCNQIVSALLWFPPLSHRHL